MNKISRWIPNMQNITEKHTVGKCPFCQSENTDFSVVEILNKQGYCSIWCNNCKEGIHISKMNISPEMLRVSAIPKDINF